MKIGLLITIISSLVLSWCWLQQNDDFEKKVKCYELWKEYISKLSKEEDIKEKESPDYYDANSYDIVMSVYSKEANTCILYFKEYNNNTGYEKIIDLLNNRRIATDVMLWTGDDSHFNSVLLYLWKVQDEWYHSVLNAIPDSK